MLYPNVVLCFGTECYSSGDKLSRAAAAASLKPSSTATDRDVLTPLSGNVRNRVSSHFTLEPSLHFTLEPSLHFRTEWYFTAALSTWHS